MFKATSIALLAIAVIAAIVLFVFFGLTSNGVFGVIAPIIAFVGSLFLLFVVIYTSASVNTWVTFVREGTMKIVTANGKFITVILNQKGYYFDKEKRKVLPVTDKREDKVSGFTKLTGLYFVSFVFPLQEVYEFKILKVRLQKGRDKMDNIRQKIDRDTKKTTVDYLLFMIDRPFLLLDVDLSDGTRVHILGKGVYRVYDPIRMIFELNAQFFDNLDTLVKAYIINKYKHISINDLRKSPNPLVDPLELVGAYDVEDVVGLHPESLVVEEWSLSEKDKAIQDAIEAKNIAMKQGDAEIAKAVKAGQAQVKTSVYNLKAKTNDGLADGAYQENSKRGIAKGEGALVREYGENGIPGAQVARILTHREISKLNGTYFEGGSGIQPVAAVTVNPKSSQPVSPAPLPEMVTAPATTGPKPQPQQPASKTSPSLGASFGGGKKKRRWDKQPPQQ